jgi:hypothetical protein
MYRLIINNYYNNESISRLLYLCVYDSRDSSHHPAPSPSLGYSLTHAHRSIGYHNGYHNRNPQTLTESTVRLMHLRVHDNRDNSPQPEPSPSLVYSLTHVHRSIGYRNRNPQPLPESTVRLMHLRVYNSRDNSYQSSPSPSLVSCYVTTRTRLTVCLPAQPSVFEVF